VFHSELTLHIINAREELKHCMQRLSRV